MNIYITSLKENFPKPISKVYSLKGGKNDKRDGMLICYLYRFKIAWVILSIFQKKERKKKDCMGNSKSELFHQCKTTK